MSKGKEFVFFIVMLTVIGAAPVGRAQTPVQLKYTRVVDLTLPIESNMAGIPGLKSYAENPSRVTIIAAITEAQKELLRAEGMTLSNNLVVNGRSMISVLSILVHNGTHIDAPRHMIDKGYPVDEIPLGQVAKEAVLINLPHKGPEFVCVREGHSGYWGRLRSGCHSRNQYGLDGEDVGQA
jgi:kynurenine formamidase